MHLANVRMAFARLEGEHLLCGLRNFDFSTLRWLSDDSSLSAGCSGFAWSVATTSGTPTRWRDELGSLRRYPGRHTYLESFKVDTWAEHERQHDRFTMADREIERQVLAYAIEPVEIKHFIYARDGIPPILPQVVALLAADS